MLNVERLMASELVALSSHEVIGAALLLWSRAWKQRPAASLPDDDKVIAAFARMPLARFKKLKAEVLRGFVKCSDGRLYHRFLSIDAMRAFERKAAFRRKRETDAGRLREWRKGRVETHPETPSETPHETNDETPPETRFDTRFVAEGQDSTVQGHIRDNLPAQQLLAAGGARAAPENEFDLVADACVRAVGDAAPLDLAIGPMVELARRHGLERLEIALRSEVRRPRRKAIRTWRLWAEILADSLADAPVIAGGQAIPVKPPEPRVDLGGGCNWPHSTIIQSLERWAVTGSWNIANRNEGDVRGIPLEIIPAAARELLKLASSAGPIT